MNKHNLSSFSSVRGMRDLLPDDYAKKRIVEEIVRELFQLYGYNEIQTPIVEYLDVLAAKSGEDIRHRMYTFNDLGGRKLALRPEMTAPVARLVATKLGSQTRPLRLGYIANCFRYDNPQLGRNREFWHAGFELLGSDRPEADAEILMISNDLMRTLGFNNFYIKIGNIGILREVFNNENIEDFDQSRIMDLIDKNKNKQALDLLGRIKVSTHGQETLRKLLDLKGQDSEVILDKGSKVLSYLERASENLNRLGRVLDLVRSSGAECTFLVDLGFARGLEYYTGIIFEIFIPKLDIALGGGGRYDNLVKLFGGKQTPAVGLAAGIDRIILAMEQNRFFPEHLITVKRVLIIPVDEDTSLKAMEIANSLRRRGIVVHVEVCRRVVGKALQYANKEGYRYAVIVGPQELERGCIIIRDMKRKSQREVAIEKVVTEMMTQINN